LWKGGDCERRKEEEGGEEGGQVGERTKEREESRVDGPKWKENGKGNSRLYFFAVSLKKASSSERAFALARECLDLREAF